MGHTHSDMSPPRFCWTFVTVTQRRQLDHHQQQQQHQHLAKKLVALALTRRTAVTPEGRRAGWGFNFLCLGVAGVRTCRKWRASAKPLFKSSLVRMDSSMAVSGEECLAISFVELNYHSLTAMTWACGSSLQLASLLHWNYSVWERRFGFANGLTFKDIWRL